MAGVITDSEGDAASPTRRVGSRRDSEEGLLHQAVVFHLLTDYRLPRKRIIRRHASIVAGSFTSP
jgi:hypothetical protein